MDKYDLFSFFAGLLFAIGIGFLVYEWQNDWVARIDVIISALGGVFITLSLCYMLSFSSEAREEDI